MRDGVTLRDGGAADPLRGEGGVLGARVRPLARRLDQRGEPRPPRRGDRRDGPWLPRGISCRPGIPGRQVGGDGAGGRGAGRLPKDAVECAVLLSPALSPTYDLVPALRAVRREMVVFWSPLDVIVLGLGTRIFGTIDRIKTVSAGLVGFRGPREGRHRPRGRLPQAPPGALVRGNGDYRLPGRSRWSRQPSLSQEICRTAAAGW